VAEAADQGLLPVGSPLADAVARGQVDAAAVFAAVEDGDVSAAEIVERLGDRLARVCVLLASLLDIERVVVAGAIAGPAHRVIGAARRLLDAWHYDPVPEIVASTLGADVVVLGAVALALDVVQEQPLALRLPGVLSAPA
jgi:predicted NBD/HSP70 family sugar kinase